MGLKRKNVMVFDDCHAKCRPSPSPCDLAYTADVMTSKATNLGVFHERVGTVNRSMVVADVLIKYAWVTNHASGDRTQP